MSHEAWKDTGDCRECRRRKYCRKECTASKKKTKSEVIVRAFMAPITKEHMYEEFADRVKSSDPHVKRKIIVHGAMIYGCQDCGNRWAMFLEKGLEEKCDDRKPVPFGIICPFCGGFHAYDISGYLPLPDTKYAELPEGESYFENRPDSDCGIPRIANPPRRFSVNQKARTFAHLEG